MTAVTDIDRPPFGRLRYGKEYGSEFWLGSVAVSGFEQPFSVIVRAGTGGPSAKQVAAMTVVLNGAGSLLQAATREMLALHGDLDLSPAVREAAEKDVWSLLVPEQIDVSDESYYGDGRIAIALIFVSTIVPDFAPAIQTADGRFDEVLSAT